MLPNNPSKIIQKTIHIRGIWWDGSKSHRKRHVSREVICMRNWDGSTWKWLKISITCFFAEMAHFSRLKIQDGSKFEAFRFSNSCSFRILSHLDYFSTEKVSHLSRKTRDRDSEPFSNWAISISHAYHFTWDMSPSMTFWAISPFPLYTEFSMCRGR